MYGTDAIKPLKQARLGLYSIGHPHYWDQFDGLRQRIDCYNRHVETKLSQWGAVTNAGIVDSVESARAAAARMSAQNVDIIFCHAATYAMSASHITIAQTSKKPVVVLNLQPTAAINYEKAHTGEWLAHCAACCVPEISNAFNRFDIPFHLVSGLLGLGENSAASLSPEKTAEHPEARRAWKEIGEWVRAAQVARTLREGRMGFLGHTYPGMLDMYSDFTMISSQTGMHVEILEMCDLEAILRSVPDCAVEAKVKEAEALFEVSQDSPSDPLARKPKPEQLRMACRVAEAQERLVREFDLDALTYYYRGREGNGYRDLQESFILGHSLLTARGIPCSGEGDMKTAVAMKICDIIGAGGSFSELVAVDYDLGTLILGHDGPFHLRIADGKPSLRGMGGYHGKWGSGVSVEATVKKGVVTLLNLTQKSDGRLHFIVNSGEAIDAPILRIGNTMTHVRFGAGPTETMDRWFGESPTHHCAMSVGDNRSAFKKIAAVMDIQCRCLS